MSETAATLINFYKDFECNLETELLKYQVFHSHLLKYESQNGSSRETDLFFDYYKRFKDFFPMFEYT